MEDFLLIYLSGAVLTLVEGTCNHSLNHTHSMLLLVVTLVMVSLSALIKKFCTAIHVFVMGALRDFNFPKKLANQNTGIFGEMSSLNICLKCFDTVGWAAGRASDL